MNCQKWARPKIKKKKKKDLAIPVDMKVGLVGPLFFTKPNFNFRSFSFFFFLGTIASLSKFTDHPLLQCTLKSDLIYDNHFPDIHVNCDGIVDA